MSELGIEPEELDRQLAIRVMHWRDLTQATTYELAAARAVGEDWFVIDENSCVKPWSRYLRQETEFPEWQPSCVIADAWQVAMTLLRDGFSLELTADSSANEAQFLKAAVRHTHRSNTAALAIAGAALKASGWRAA